MGRLALRLSIERRIGGMTRGRRDCARALAGTCCALVGACAPLSTPPGGGDALQAAFVVLGEEGRPVARAITSAAGCPVLVADGSLFPTCVGVNPQISIMAFATRIAAHIGRNV